MVTRARCFEMEKVVGFGSSFLLGRSRELLGCECVVQMGSLAAASAAFCLAFATSL